MQAEDTLRQMHMVHQAKRSSYCLHSPLNAYYTPRALYRINPDWDDLKQIVQKYRKLRIVLQSP